MRTGIFLTSTDQMYKETQNLMPLCNYRHNQDVQETTPQLGFQVFLDYSFSLFTSPFHIPSSFLSCSKLFTYFCNHERKIKRLRREGRGGRKRQNLTICFLEKETWTRGAASSRNVLARHHMMNVNTVNELPYLWILLSYSLPSGHHQFKQRVSCQAVALVS